MARERVSEIVAEMVANVLSVSVEAGDKVAAGDVVIVLESMKMEIPVIAEDDGTVRSVKIAPADVVQDGDVMLELVLDE
jgi:acetyl-CoA carboxylase biotin carboxyl carrier protein